MSDEPNSLTRILFVDDSKVMVKTASKILSAEFDVVTAVDGDDAWGKLERDHDIQVLFTDINMPGTDGYGLLKKVRTADDSGLRGIPVILVTGADDAESAREKAMDRGATDFIDKRAISSELLPRARAHAKYQRMTKQLQAQATLDLLTGLANESGFLAHFEQDIHYARRHKQQLALMRVEIDGLVSTFQDRGEAVVEQVVAHVAAIIRTRIRKEDTAARIGLSGFAISAPGGQLEGIEAEAASLRALASMHALEIDGQIYPISLRTAVIGSEPDVWTSAREAMQHCQALLDSKRQLAAARSAQERAEQPQPTRPAPISAPAPTRKPEPAVAQKTPTREPPRVEPVREQPRVEPPRQQPKTVRTQEVVKKAPTALQRSLSFLRQIGSRVARFYRKLVGR